ncbi:hypothetical protein LCGC14_1868830 [marine sediment metagenome]|uniref:Uncharacterized protein n=1 Tax=marine sediment metagenome TaxID=412755 RepID=A0A0F9G5H7_9ZZZZ
MKVKHLKKWLDNFIDEADVEYTISLRHHTRTGVTVTLHITYNGQPSVATLDLDKEEGYVQC